MNKIDKSEIRLKVDQFQKLALRKIGRLMNNTLTGIQKTEVLSANLKAEFPSIATTSFKILVKKLKELDEITSGYSKEELAKVSQLVFSILDKPKEFQDRMIAKLKKGEQKLAYRFFSLLTITFILVGCLSAPSTPITTGSSPIEQPASKPEDNSPIIPIQTEPESAAGNPPTPETIRRQNALNALIELGYIDPSGTTVEHEKTIEHEETTEESVYFRVTSDVTPNETNPSGFPTGSLFKVSLNGNNEYIITPYTVDGALAAISKGGAFGGESGTDSPIYTYFKKYIDDKAVEIKIGDNDEIKLAADNLDLDIATVVEDNWQPIYPSITITNNDGTSVTYSWNKDSRSWDLEEGVAPEATETAVPPELTATAEEEPAPKEQPATPIETATPIVVENPSQTFSSAAEALTAFSPELSTAFTLEAEGGQFPKDIIVVDENGIVTRVSTDNIVIHAEDITKDPDGKISDSFLHATVTDEAGKQHELYWTPSGWGLEQFSNQNYILTLDTTNWTEDSPEERPDEFTYALIPGNEDIMKETGKDQAWIYGSPWWRNQEDGLPQKPSEIIEDQNDGTSILDASVLVFKTIIATGNPSPTNQDVIDLREALNNNEKYWNINGKKIDLTAVTFGEKTIDLTKKAMLTVGQHPENGNSRVGTNALILKNSFFLSENGMLYINIAPKGPGDIIGRTFTYEMANILEKAMNIQPTVEDKAPINKAISDTSIGIYKGTAIMSPMALVSTKIPDTLITGDKVVFFEY